MDAKERNIPKITLIDGREIELPRPTMKMWRSVAQYDEVDKSEWGIIALMDEHSKMIKEMYGLDSVDDIDPADVLPKYVESATYVIGIVNEKLKKLPKNADAGKDAP